MIKAINCNVKRKYLVLPIEGVKTMHCHESCIHNEVRSLYGRVLKHTPDVHQDILKYLSTTTVNLAHQVRDQKLTGVATSSQLISYFPQRRRKLYARAVSSLLSLSLAPKDWFVKSFVKMEKIEILAKDGDPRMIQARDVRFNCELGKYTRPIEKALYTLRDPETGLPLIAKGLNMRERATLLKKHWDMMHNPVCISGDLSRFDLSTREEIISVMHKFYLTVIDDNYLKELLLVQLRNRGRTANNVKYATCGGVMSGDMTTALGNCVAVVTILMTLRNLTKVPEALEELGLKPPTRKIFFHILDDGDDHTIICEKEDKEWMMYALPKWFLLCGHTFKVEGYTDQWNQILFCQMKPIMMNYGPDMMPDPRKVLATAFMVSGARAGDIKQLIPYLGTIWEARAIMHQGMPILGPLFARLASQNKARMKNPTVEVIGGLKYLLDRDGRTSYRNDPITPDARLQCFESWGLHQDDQIKFENLQVPMPTQFDIHNCIVHHYHHSIQGFSNIPY